jgi:hypothetical protein
MLLSGNAAEKFPPAGGRGFLNSADNTPYEKNGDEVRSLADAVKSTRT